MSEGLGNERVDKLSSDLYFLRRRLEELILNFEPTISKSEAGSFVSEIMSMIDNKLERRRLR